jgi:membrane protease YdiL (CAAX protease family)
MTARSRTRDRRPTKRARAAWRIYLADTHRPLTVLLFLLPLVLVHEVGAVLLRSGGWPERHLVAYSLIQQFLSWFGATGFWLPAAALTLTLVVWHLLSREPTRVRAWELPLMAAESIVLTMPLFVLGEVLLQAGTSAPAVDIRAQVVLALGAGIYEELVFRLYLIVGIAWLLDSALGVDRTVARIAAILLSALAFALCHFAPVGSEPFQLRHFLVLLLAGVYLAVLFVLRGLAIAAGCHAAFNLIPVLSDAWANWMTPSAV